MSNNNTLKQSCPPQSTPYYPLCDSHKNISMYYLKHNLKRRNFCEQCIEELCIQKYESIPNLKHQNESKLFACKDRSVLLKKEIERIETSLTNYMSKFEIENASQIDEFFDFLYKIIQYNHTTVKNLFNQCKNEQKEHIDKKLSELNTLKKNIAQYEKEITQLIKDNNSEQMLNISKQIKLNSIVNKLSNLFNYDNKLDLLQMKLEIKNEMKETFFDLIQNSYAIDIDFLKMKNGAMPTIKELLDKDNTWQCICGCFDNNVNNIICKECKRYRKLESYDNLIFNPMKVTSFEIEALLNRRKSEIKEFQLLLKKDCDATCNYALDIIWFLEWKCFVMNDLSDNYIKNESKRISENTLIGVLYPNYISNARICDKGDNGEYKLKNNLIRNSDYIVVNEFIWRWFLLNYAGGPEVKVDDYSNSNINKDTNNNNNEVIHTESAPSASNEYSTVGKYQSASLMNETTVNKIAPVAEYNFCTKFNDFKLNEGSVDDSNGEFNTITFGNEMCDKKENMKMLLNNISIKDNI